MPNVRIKLAAATWTDLTTAIAPLGNSVVVLTTASDVQLGRKATAPTAGVAMVANDSAEVIITQGSALKLWAYSTAGTILTVEQAGPKKVIIDGTGTT